MHHTASAWIWESRYSVSHEKVRQTLSQEGGESEQAVMGNITGRFSCWAHSGTYRMLYAPQGEQKVSADRLDFDFTWQMFFLLKVTVSVVLGAQSHSKFFASPNSV